VHAIPGQHDLPMHRLEDVKKSAYWTLVEAGVVEDIWTGSNNGWVVKNRLHVNGFPWGTEVCKLEGREDCLDSHGVQLSLAHRYVWVKGHSYPNALVEQRLDSLQTCLDGYDVAVFGDNHQAFLAESGNCQVVNCGCLIRRKSDEREYTPSVWLISGRGGVSQIALDTSGDRWLESSEAASLEGSINPDLDRFVEELGGLDADQLNFRDDLLRYIDVNKVGLGTKSIIMEVLEGGK
jgi:hypothetical protein